MAKFVIFDMDGVIVDSEYIFLGTKTEMLLDRGIDTDISYQYQFMGTTFDVMWTQMKEEKGLTETVPQLIAEMNRRREEKKARDGVRPIKGAPELIRYLYENGYRMAVASSSPKEEIIRNLEALGIADAFEFKVSGEEVAKPKPAPDVFLKAAELLGAEASSCTVIEDTKLGSQAAKAAGMRCLGFENPDYPAQDLSACDHVVTDYKDIYQYFD
ncbi:HAD family hydrolase [Streptococcus loxodontisalivarius]|uniref:HAD superfamily hydrolase (TIGR01509 family) n=1 Tax=Streptococcus loxodontisalivarius TaxID=1349415 RepID=A0ABS2PT93_9STRE|nr:HAD family hydrolase [Streptococcus loxodontisalivarius]MBM7643263.1 HAD superfamily hydrolase (TIGR01509 family) [Streptococcus loxodontisalivarius]